MSIDIVPYDSLGRPPLIDLRPWDPRALRVAERIICVLQNELPGVVAEHIGSTSIPGCDGKGVVDLMVVVPNGMMNLICASVDRLGFQRQSGGIIHSDERPMREGGVEYAGDFFRLHIHLVPERTSQVDELRRFRELLRANPELVNQYVAFKRELCASLPDRVTYTRSKSLFIRSILSRIHP